MNRPTCTYSNTASMTKCSKPAVAWSNSLFSLGIKVFFCEDCLARAKSRKINVDRKFHKVMSWTK